MDNNIEVEKLPLDVWRESGWYDCCSGLWFLTYNLLDKGEETDTVANSEDYIGLYYLEKNRPDLLDRDEDDKEYKDALEETQKLYIIERDETIDYDLDARCS